MKIPVVHCCGVFGFQLPWPHWMCLEIYPSTGDEKHIYIYSIKGQLGHPDREKMVTPPPNCKNCPTRINNPNTIACINVDQYIDWDSLALCTYALARAITAEWLKQFKKPEPPPAPTPAPTAPTAPTPEPPVETKKKPSKRKKK